MPKFNFGEKTQYMRSLKVVTSKKDLDISAGIIEPGDHDLGTHNVTLELRVGHGVLVSQDGTRYTAKSDPLVFQKNEEIKFSCSEVVSFTCRRL